MKTVNEILQFLIENWAVIAPLLYEFLVRVIPTAKNWSIISLLIPNNRKKLQMVILFVLASIGSYAQLDGTFKTLRLVNVADSTTVLPINMTLYYNQQSHKPRIYYNNAWHDLTGSSGGGGGGITNSAANTELMMSDGTNAVPSNIFKTNTNTTVLGNNSTAGSRVLSHQSSDGSADLTISNAPTGGSTAIQFTKGSAVIKAGATTFRFYDASNFSNVIGEFRNTGGVKGLFMNGVIGWSTAYGGNIVAPSLKIQGAQCSANSPDEGNTGPIIIKSGKALPSGGGIVNTGSVTMYTDSTTSGNSGDVNIATGTGNILTGSINIIPGANNTLGSSSSGNIKIISRDSTIISSRPVLAGNTAPDYIFDVSHTIVKATDSLGVDQALIDVSSDGNINITGNLLNYGNSVLNSTLLSGSPTFTGNVSFTSHIVAKANTSSNTLIIESQASDPTSPVNGMWLNDSDNSGWGSSAYQYKASIDGGDALFLTARTNTSGTVLDFPSTAANASSELTISTGISGGINPGMPVVVSGLLAPPAKSMFTAYVDGSSNVIVRFNNYSTAAINPASDTYVVRVLR